jgi:hypothetical protein
MKSGCGITKAGRFSTAKVDLGSEYFYSESTKIERDRTSLRTKEIRINQMPDFT